MMFHGRVVALRIASARRRTESALRYSSRNFTRDLGLGTVEMWWICCGVGVSPAWNVQAGRLYHNGELHGW